MPEQTILWTAVPNGVSGEGAGRRVRLSVFVSPRLRLADGEGDTLSLLPDFLNWPQTVQDYSFAAQFEGGPTVPATTATPSVLRPDLWTHLFKPDTFVRSHTYDDYSKHLLISYPVRPLVNGLRRLYQGISLESPHRLRARRNLIRFNGSPPPLGMLLVELFGFGFAPGTGFNV